MGNFVFNVAKGKVAEKVADGATIKLLVLKAAASDATNKDFDTIAAILGGGNTEADFTNYARATLGSLTAAADDSTDTMKVDCADITFTSAGGATNNTTTDVIIYEEVGGGDSNCIPLVQLDAVFTTDGNNVTLTVHADGWFNAT